MRIAAVEHSIPSLQVTNDDIIKELLARSARHLDVPSSALLARTLEALFKRSRSVVRYRHVAPEKAIDFGVDAGRQAIATAGMVPEDIDLLIYVGVSRGFLEPATANVFQHELGFTKATCFDVLDACASWVRAFDVARCFLKAKAYRRIMILSCETSGAEHCMPVIENLRQLSYSFPALTIGEAATATILVEDDDDDDDEYYSTFRSNGANYLLCGIPLPNFDDYTRDYDKGTPKLLELYSYADELLSRVFKDLVQHYHDISAINSYRPDFFTGHSASEAVSESAIDAIGLPKELGYCTHSRYGNTVSSSVPLALSLAAKEGRLLRGQRVMIGFGSAGTSTAWIRFRY